MNGDSSRMIAEIKTAIEKGTLTHSEMERRLEAAIAAETSKEDSSADIEIIRACQSLLWELDTHGKAEMVDDTEQALAAFKAKKHAGASTQRKLPVFALRTAIAATAILIAVFCIDALVRREWLVGNSTDDEQQYVISGQEIDPGIMNDGKADDSTTQPQEITTTDMNEIVALLGFTPAMPQWMPDGWELYSYYASRAASGKRFIATFAHAEQEYYWIYQMISYGKAERASAVFEQNALGEELILANGNTIYIAENYSDTSCVWREGLVCYSLMAPQDSNICTQIIESIKESP